MKILLPLFIIAANTFNPILAQKKAKTSAKDFQQITGNWQGSLTYLDYSTNKPYTMPANVEVRQIANTNSFIFSNTYPKETNANSADTVVILANGKYIGKELVVSRKHLSKNSIEIITEEAGTDGNDNKPATFKHTYSFSTTTLTIRKDVQFKGETKWINRHVYSYKRS